eukprot:scaffold792_cov163-Amphora_coffeaeformis.AAC.7
MDGVLKSRGILLKVFSVLVFIAFATQLSQREPLPSVEKVEVIKQYTYTDSSTIVSAYYEFKSKHSVGDYRSWMMNLFSLQDPMVIFTSGDLAPMVLEGRAKFNATHKTKVVVLELNETNTSKMHDLAYWEKQHSMDPERRTHPSYLLYWVWLSKSELVKRAIDMDPFQSEFYAWVDAGYFRNDRWNGQKMLQHIPPDLHDDQVLFLEVAMRGQELGVGGGFLGGYPPGIRRWNELFYSMLREHESEFIGKEQDWFSKTCLNTSGLCLMVQPGHASFGDKWFFMAPFLILGQNETGGSVRVPY